MKRARHPRPLWLGSVVLALSGCGSGGDARDNGVESGDGTVTEPWLSFCTATFTEDTPIVSPFDEVFFTARAGDEFLLSYFDDTFDARAELLFLTSSGPDWFEVEPRADGTWPFASRCGIGEGEPYAAVFADVSVFAEQELTTKVCDLSAGSALPVGNGGSGHSLVGTSGEATIYNVILGPFSAECGGRSDGYIRVPRTESLGSTTWLVPIAHVLAPP